MFESERGKFLPVVNELYAAALDVEATPDFLAAAAALLSADNAYLSRIEHDRRTLEYVVLRPQSWDVVSVERYAELMNSDPRIAAFRSNPGRAVHCREATSQARLHASRIYREALRPLGIEYTMIVSIPEPGSTMTNYLGLTRGRFDTPFDAADCTLLNELAPHLCRAMAIRRVLDEQGREQGVLKQLLRHLPQAAFILDRSGMVQHLNEPARVLSEAGLGVRLVEKHLRIGRDADHDRFLSALAAAISGASVAPQKIVLEPVGAKAPLTLTVEPPVRATGLSANDRGLAIVSVEPAGPQDNTDENLLRTLFGLTPAQVRLTLLLASGRSVREAVGLLGITEGSARQYMKIIFAKTGAKRQADLVRLVLNALSGPRL